MYVDFYGLKERPFQLLPDPRFLFLSRSHREALAHLLYGLEAGEGFIQVVGQVGTGKTTLCRTLLGRVGSEVEIAYIFNPSPSEIELLAALNREFGLPTVARSRGELIDELNKFLLEKRAQDRRVLLVIDEAQNLEPGVLEQIRLLSNLETEHEKLLQIALIGQPELDENLARSDLRQLRQRITVRWDLRPFDRNEVGEYLNHRLQVAGLERPDLFSAGAVRGLYRGSRGIPRVINAIADRALLSAYSKGKARVDARTVRAVSRELPSSEGGWSRPLGVTPPTATALIACGLLLGFFATLWWPEAFASRSSEPAVASAPAAASVGPTPAEARPPATPGLAYGREAVERYLLERGPKVTAAGALDALLWRWGHEGTVGGEVDPNLIASAVRDVAPLSVLVTRFDLQQLGFLNLPAILELEPAPGQRRYAAVLEVSADGFAHLALRDQEFEIDAAALSSFWTGRTFLLWTNFESMPALQSGMNGSAVRWLQARLTDLGYLQRGDATGEFDAYTVSAIRRFQTEHGIDDTGQVGAETLIAIYQRLDYPSPRLLEDGTLS